MFATVEFFERENSIKERLKRALGRSGIISERVNLPENEYFYRLRVPVHKGKIPAEGLKRVATAFVDGLIFPSDFLPDGEYRVFTPNYFREILLFNSAISQLHKSLFNPAETTVTLIDKRGVLHTEAERLVPFAGEFKIITDNIRVYEGTAERLVKEYGLSLFVSDKLSAIPEKGIIISLHSNVVPVYFKGLLITGEKRLLPFARVLTGEGIKTKGNYEALCPSGTDMTVFLSALCEVCFIKELRASEYEKLVDISL